MLTGGFASKAQIAKFGELRKQGKISGIQIATRSLKTDFSNLPDRVKGDKKSK